MNEERVQRYKEKEEYFAKLIGKLKEWTKDLNEKEFITKLNLREQFSIYHAYQIILEIITDLTAMIIKDLKIIPKDDYINIEVLAEKGIISKDLSYNLKQANGLRNRIVHSYNSLNEEIAFKSIQKYLEELEKYKEAIDSWLQKSV